MSDLIQHEFRNGRYFPRIGKTKCLCDCHTDGSIHFMPCCNDGFKDKIIYTDSFKDATFKVNFKSALTLEDFQKNNPKVESVEYNGDGVYTLTLKKSEKK